MLRAFFLLFSYFADYRTWIDMANTALILGLVNAGVFSCFGIRYGIRHSMVESGLCCRLSTGTNGSTV